MTPWTVRFYPAIDVDAWADGKPISALAEFHDWVASCQEHGPPVNAWLVELEEGYRYRYWLIESNVTIEFIAVAYERWMLITKLD
ncbi:MAG: hypothetical protein ACREGR_03930 [Minisyncoccia bacterium]